MWQINKRWFCATPEIEACIAPRHLQPLKNAMNLTLGARNIGDGVYTKKQMDGFKKFIASKAATSGLISELAETLDDEKSSHFNWWPLLKLSSMTELTQTISDRFFGIFAGLDQYLYPAMTMYTIWSLFLFMVRGCYTVHRVIKEHGLKPSKLLMALLDPIIYLMWLPLTLDFGRKDPIVPNAPSEEPVSHPL